MYFYIFLCTFLLSVFILTCGVKSILSFSIMMFAFYFVHGEGKIMNMKFGCDWITPVSLVFGSFFSVFSMVMMVKTFPVYFLSGAG